MAVQKILDKAFFFVYQDIVSAFFGAPQNKNVAAEKFDTGSLGSNSETEAFDTIDDEELLRITEPDGLRNSQQTNQWSNATNSGGYHSSQGRHYQSNFNSSVAQGGGFSSNIGFTPIQPSYYTTNQYQQASGGYSSIVVPDSFGRHDNFRYSSHAGHSSVHSGQFESGRLSRFSPQGGNYQGEFGYDHSARYYTQQFM